MTPGSNKPRDTTKRLFIAFPPDKRFVKMIEKYRDQYGRLGWIRWVSLADLHVTALFLGDIKEDQLPDIIERIDSVISDSPRFDLTLKNVIYAPPDAYSTMVWARFEDNDVFTKIVRHLERVLSDVYNSSEVGARDNIIAHATLARLRSDKLPRALLKLKKSGYEGKRMVIKNCYLYESIPGKGAPRYVALKKFSLYA